MKILNLFKRQKDKQPKEIILQASATLYPDKILIESIDRVKEGFGISSTNIEIVPVDTDSEVLGSIIRHYLSLTKTGQAIPKDYKLHYRKFLKKAGFRDGKEHHRGALLSSICQRDNQIIISPTKNGGYTGKERGFLGMRDSAITVSADISNATLGDLVRQSWTSCECNCI